jgi:predicted ATPase
VAAPASPPLFVLTGGPYSGKTTLVQALADAGLRTVPEAAIEVIERLNEIMGPANQRRWRRAHLPEFQRMVLELQLERERALPPGRAPVFLDRGVADGIAYYRDAGLESPGRLVACARARPYRRAFVLETLETFDGRRGSGRTSSRDDSVRLGALLETVYRDLGVPVTRITRTSVPERIDAVLRAAGEVPLEVSAARGSSR